MTKADFFLDVVNADRRGQAVIIVVEHEEGVDIISNSDHTDFINMMPTFMELPWKGRVPADEVWGDWSYFYDMPEEAEVYGLELEDGKIQMGILDMSIDEALKRLDEEDE